MLPNPPPGWSDLQKRAQASRNSQELSSIIAEMNRLLSTYEKAAGKPNSPDELSDHDSGVRGDGEPPRREPSPEK